MNTTHRIYTNQTRIAPQPAAAGETRWVHLAPFGEFPQGDITQICDHEAFAALARNFSADVLVDFDHRAEDGGSTEAAAWITALRIHSERGLYGSMRFTPSGAAAVNGREYRYVSPCWYLDGNGRPVRLVSVALTNKPNLPVAPVINRVSVPATATAHNEEHTMDKSKIAAALGLTDDAGEADVMTALESLVAELAEAREKLAEAEKETAEAEAEAIINAAGSHISDKNAFKTAYVANRAAGQALLATLNLKAAATVNRVPFFNRAPEQRTSGGPTQNRLEEYEALDAGPEKRKFLKNHAREINRLRVERAKGKE